jgi:VanZ family protein
LFVTARTRSFIPWLLFAVVALIVYGSLYPFNFKPDAIQGGVLEALRQLSWQRAGRGDRISNVLLYLPLGFCLFLWLDVRLRRGPAMLLAVMLGTLLSLAIEAAQVYVSSRVPSLTDLTLNAAGTLMGAAAGLAWDALTRLMHLPSRTEKARGDPGAALVIIAWLAWRLAPFAPQLDLAKLKAALRPLFDPQLDPVAVFIYLTCWLVVNQAVAALASRARRLEVLLLLIASVLVGRLLVANQAFVPAELLALLLLLPMVVLMHRLTPQPRRAALVLAVMTVLIIDGLAPFDFTTTAGRFDMWPFKSWLANGVIEAVRSIDWVELLGKVFLFATLVWVVKEWGASLRLAIAVVVTIVLAVEVLQMWLPDQRATITDPVIALAVGLLFRFLYRRRATRLAADGVTSHRRVRSR